MDVVEDDVEEVDAAALTSVEDGTTKDEDEEVTLEYFLVRVRVIE